MKFRVRDKMTYFYWTRDSVSPNKAGAKLWDTDSEGDMKILNSLWFSGLKQRVVLEVVA